MDIYADPAYAMATEQFQVIADYLNLVIQDVSISQTDSTLPDIERLNEEQPVSEAVEHV